MEYIIEQFLRDLKTHLEQAFNTLQEQDEIKKIDAIEKIANEYTDHFLLQTNLIAGDLALPVQHVLDEFIKSKIQ